MVLIVKQERETVGPRNSSTKNEPTAIGEVILKSSGESERNIHIIITTYIILARKFAINNESLRPKHTVSTCICNWKILLKKIFILHEVTNFLCENSLPVLTYTANIIIILLWCTLEVDKNIVTRIFLIQKNFCE